MRKQTLKWIKPFVTAFLIVITSVSTQAATDDWLGYKTVNQASMSGLPQKHTQFVQSVLNSTDKINKAILQDRERLTKLHSQYQQNKRLSKSDERWLYALAEEYKVARPNVNSKTTWQELNKRVDIVPVSLVLAQAIQESGWGTSKLAKKANNYFGQQCYHRGCGVPASHSRRSYHEMARYDSIHEAISTYVHNLNSNHAYRKMRDIRFNQRQNKEQINSLVLVNGLTAYSELGGRYVAKIKSVVKSLHLQRFDKFV
jgi:Bax protein